MDAFCHGGRSSELSHIFCYENYILLFNFNIMGHVQKQYKTKQIFSSFTVKFIPKALMKI